MILYQKNEEKYNCTFADIKQTHKIFSKCDYCSKEFERAKRHCIKEEKHSCGSKECSVKKRSETIIEKHGVNCFKNEFLDKAKESNVKKYGVTNPAKLDVIKNKIKKTNIKKYGANSFLSTEEAKLKRQESALERYGVEHFSQSDDIKEKIKETNIKKYGKEYFSQTKDWKSKTEKTNVDKYKQKNVMKNKKYVEKQQSSLEQKYGVKHPLQNEKINEKQKQTCIERYGVDNYAKTSEYLKKYNKTCVEKYGGHPMKTDLVKTKSMQTRLDKYGHLYHNLGKTELSLKENLNKLGFNFKSNVTVLNGKEIDLYDKEKQIAIEYCGLYWHNEKSPEPRERSYHFEKYKKCKEQNIFLITIFEDEYKYKKEQMFSVLKSKLGQFEKKIYARKCNLVEPKLEQTRDFYELNHLQGTSRGIIKSFGLEYEKELVSIMSIGRHHRDSKKLVLDRFCFKQNTQIIGGASKLWKRCIAWLQKENVDNIISWSDNRWSTGDLYKMLGFKLEKDLPPDYSYVKYGNPQKRISKQSQQKSATGCPENITEREWALQNGLARIWDCGKKRWKFSI